ncbi:FKBP-type peptidyl-prolyl cis-trans isomerase [Chrysiogenes arsenatis]|uniref:FKBP-type peptidyl-prolyl cis-trans isomerase n=1 Tax=Chrysiogenes arsenatis TaxID=309797 RepID=UPI0003F88484|nr:peptidylprolyl isomerase [Chrysiogenes arsenatis]
MAQAITGDEVTIHYTGTLEDGTVFDSSTDREPFVFTLGENSVIPGFETAITGMEVGTEKTVTIPAEEAYGDYDPELQQEISREALPSDILPEVGMVLEAQSETGETTHVTITDITEETITIDSNHPLAGEDLTFEIKLLSAQKGTTKKKEHCGSGCGCGH